jgi:hypothetical protein
MKWKLNEKTRVILADSRQNLLEGIKGCLKAYLKQLLWYIFQSLEFVFTHALEGNNKMLVSTGLKDWSIWIGNKIKTMVADIREPTGRLEITASPKNIRKEKVLAVRQQLAQDKYDLNGRLDLVLDSLLEDIIGRDSLSNRTS